jgi:serine/threonine protein kinase
MAILPGKRLGPYEILSAIGAGGMGEVYKARDTRLDRTVAIKILPEHLADRPELRERFEREAKAIAGLNHPHICTLYDVGHENRAEFLVMEYLEGETLAQRLAKGALPVQQTLQYAIEIADALDKAHHKGITHRDLKPGNIMLTKTGTKLLDFGLAKLTQGAAPVTPESQMPTMKDAITAQGMILGTLQYMAPEQVEGKLDQIDARTDIFAFGVLAYEMTTGRKAFEGKTQASLIAKILEVDPPPISKLQPMTPPAFDRLVKVCLAKEPDDRWQTASDLRRELEWIWQGEADADGFNSVPKINRRQLFATAISSGVVTALLGLSIAHFREGSLVPEREVRTEINTPPTTDPFSFALSPDGSEIVFVASGDGPSGLWLRRLDVTSWRSLAGTEGAQHPFWSPDGRSIGFFADGKLKRTDVNGGFPETLANSINYGGAWAQDGTILFVATNTTALSRVRASGGEATVATTLGTDRSHDRSHRFPQFLPDGRQFLFYSASSPETAGIYLGSLDNFTTKRLAGADSPAAFLPNGWLLFARAGQLLAQKLDLRHKELVG